MGLVSYFDFFILDQDDPFVVLATLLIHIHWKIISTKDVGYLGKMVIVP